MGARDSDLAELDGPALQAEIRRVAAALRAGDMDDDEVREAEDHLDRLADELERRRRAEREGGLFNGDTILLAEQNDEDEDPARRDWAMKRRLVLEEWARSLGIPYDPPPGIDLADDEDFESEQTRLWLIETALEELEADAAASDDPDLADLGVAERIILALQLILESGQLADDVAARLRQMLEPQNLALLVTMLTVFLAAGSNPLVAGAGILLLFVWLGDLAVLLGKALYEIATARTVEEFEAGVAKLSKFIAQAFVDLLAAAATAGFLRTRPGRIYRVTVRRGYGRLRRGLEARFGAPPLPPRPPRPRRPPWLEEPPPERPSPPAPRNGTRPHGPELNGTAPRLPASGRGGAPHGNGMHGNGVGAPVPGARPRVPGGAARRIPEEYFEPAPTPRPRVLEPVPAGAAEPGGLAVAPRAAVHRRGGRARLWVGEATRRAGRQPPGSTSGGGRGRRGSGRSSRPGDELPPRPPRPRRPASDFDPPMEEGLTAGRIREVDGIPQPRDRIVGSPGTRGGNVADDTARDIRSLLREEAGRTGRSEAELLRALDHAEGQAVALMRQHGWKELVLDINNTHVCPACRYNIQLLLRPDMTLIVRLRTAIGVVMVEFRGNVWPPQVWPW